MPVLPQNPLARLPRAAALCVLALLVAAMAWSAWAVPGLDPVEPHDAAAAEAESSQESIGDFALYALIAQRVQAGEPYYEAALAEQRANNYPTKPFVTVRLPTLAWGHGLLGQIGMQVLTGALLLAVIALFVWRFRGTLHRYEITGGVLVLILGGAGVFTPMATHSHELVAGLLLSMALLAYHPQRWWPSLLLAAMALLVRELALPFLLLWFAFAVMQKSWREMAALLGVLAVFALALYAHAQAIDALLTPIDRASPGWAGMAGPALPLRSLTELTFLLALPKALAASLALLPLLGWTALGGRIGSFAALWFAGFFLAMAIFARVENFYWIALVLPAYLAGYAVVPRAIAHLIAAATGRKESQY